MKEKKAKKSESQLHFLSEGKNPTIGAVGPARRRVQEEKKIEKKGRATHVLRGRHPTPNPPEGGRS